MRRSSETTRRVSTSGYVPSLVEQFAAVEQCNRRLEERQSQTCQEHALALEKRDKRLLLLEQKLLDAHDTRATSRPPPGRPVPRPGITRAPALASPVPRPWHHPCPGPPPAIHQLSTSYPPAVISQGALRRTSRASVPRPPPQASSCWRVTPLDCCTSRGSKPSCRRGIAPRQRIWPY